MLPRRLNRKEKLEAAWLNKLRDHIVSITPRGNSKNVMVNRASGGSTISLINQAKTASNKSSAYAGYFLCTLASTTTMTVASGECLINNSWFTVAEDTKTISESGYIYLNANYTAPVLDEYDNIVTAGSIDTPTIETSASLPTYSDSKFQVIIAEVTFAASAITDFIQEQHGMLLGFLFDDMSDNLNDDILDEIEQQQADQYCRTQSGCTSPSVCRNTGAYDISGSSRSSVDTIVTNMSDTEDSTTRDDYATGLDGGMWQESCGYYTARDNTTEDGVTYNARMYICGCNATEDDSVDELTDCAENNDDCFDEDCEEQTVMTSDTLGDETSCINAKNARSTPDGLGEICTTYDGEKTYWKACGKKDTTECTHAEVGGVDQWTFTTAPCCCPLTPCPNTPGFDLRDTLTNKTTITCTFTNATTCVATQWGFSGSVWPEGTINISGTICKADGTSQPWTYSKTTSTETCAGGQHSVPSPPSLYNYLPPGASLTFQLTSVGCTFEGTPRLPDSNCSVFTNLDTSYSLTYT